MPKEDEKKNQNGSDDLKKMREQMQTLTDSLTMLSENQGKFMEGLSQMSESIRSLREVEKDDDKKQKQRTDVNLETLDRAGFMNVILDRLNDILDEKVKPVQDRVQDVDDRGLRAEIDRQVKTAASDHADFWEWREEMGAVAKRSPGLSVEECYQLARVQNRKKADEMDEKFKSEEQKQEEEKALQEKAKDKEPAYGGLTPTSGKTVEKDDMTLDDAAETAFDEVFGSNVK